MANTLQLGSVNLFAGSSGFNLVEGGWSVAAANKRPIVESAQFDSGGKLRQIRSENVVETMRLLLRGSSLDNMAAHIQQLNSQLKQAEEYHTTPWQTTRVRMWTKLWGETGTRYTTIFWGRLTFVGSPYQDFTRYQDGVEMELTIEREPFWMDGTANAKTLTGVQKTDTGTVIDLNHQPWANQASSWMESSC